MKFGYTREFRIKILSLMLRNEWLVTYGDIIKPEYFDLIDEEEVAKAIIHYRETYARSPRDAADIAALTKGEYGDIIYEIFEQDHDTTLASDLVVGFAREQALKLAILDSIDDVNRGDVAKVVPRFEEAMDVGKSLLSPGIDPIRDIDKWLYDYWSDKIPTGWNLMDHDLEGGHSAGLGIILAPPNRGKSMSLVNLGYACASILCRRDVLHFTHEMGEKQVARRYAARLTFRYPKRNEDLVAYEDDVIEAARQMMPGKIRVIYKPRMTIADMRTSIDRVIDEGLNLGLIIDDYADLMTPSRKYSERRFELSSLYEDLRGVSFHYGVPMWSASQGTRASLSKEIITMADIAEDIGKAAIADVIIALCQTYDEEQAHQCRLFLTKVRDSGKNVMYAAKFFSNQQAIITTARVKRKEKKDTEGKEV